MRVAIAGFLHETNTFGPSKATWDDFVAGPGHMPMSEGEEIIARSRGCNQGVAGVVAAAEGLGWTLAPALWCATSPSAHVTRDAYERIADRMIDRLVAAGPLDGLYLDLHGAMVAEHLDDGEGELLARIRAALGPDLPIVVSLDLHANVTPLMVQKADVLDSYRTYPHVDMAETGRRCAAILDRLMRSGERPEKAFLQAPFLTAISWQCTDLAPAKGLYALLRALDRDLVSISLNMGFPAADFPDCGMSVTAYGPGAQAAARRLMDAVEAAEAQFAGEVLTPDAAVARAMALSATAKGPVLIADTQDNPGAGGDSDTMGMLRALVAGGATNAAIGSIFDPAAARAAHAAGPGATVRLALGAKSAIPGDAPFEADFTVEAVTDGRFRAKGPYYGDRAMDMGPSACLRIGGVRVAVVSAKAQMADREMFRQVGIEPEAASVLVLKSSVHFRADFAPIASHVLIAAAPGPMAADPADLPWTRLRPGLRLSPLGRAFTPTEPANACA
ncbi:MAG: M81 family metallopeptidase [Rubrimonas sp.]